MPKSGYERDLPTDLRKTIAANLAKYMAEPGAPKTAKAIQQATDGKVGYKTVERALKAQVAITIDTLQAICDALQKQPWELVTSSETQAVLARVFGKTPTVGPEWKRTDKKPLLQGSERRENPTKPDHSHPKDRIRSAK